MLSADNHKGLKKGIISGDNNYSEKQMQFSYDTRSVEEQQNKGNEGGHTRTGAKQRSKSQDSQKDDENNTSYIFRMAQPIRSNT